MDDIYISKDVQNIELVVELDMNDPNVSFVNNTYTYDWSWIYSPDSMSVAGINTPSGDFKGRTEVVTDALEPRIEKVQYVVNVFTNGICPSTTIINVDIDYALFIPSIFSPSPGRQHPIWIIENSDLYPNLTVEVFNRWGTLVYQVDGGYNNDWDGTSSTTGKDLPDGTYFYIVNTAPGSETNFNQTGSITIVR
jgi:gliding motility-associated-like protein